MVLTYRMPVRAACNVHTFSHALAQKKNVPIADRAAAVVDGGCGSGWSKYNIILCNCNMYILRKIVGGGIRITIEEVSEPPKS